MARLFVHIGGFKTGSTAIQAFLRAQRDWFAGQGCHVPIAGMDPGGRHLPLVRALVERGAPPRFARHPQALADELAAVPDKDAVISCETLETSLAKALPYLRGLGRELRVILYVRNQPQRLNSGYMQRSRMLRPDRTILDHAAAMMMSGGLHYSGWLRLPGLAPEELVFRPYTGAVRADVIADFCRTLGLASDDRPASADNQKNVSASAVGVAALRLSARLLTARNLQIDVPTRDAVVAQIGAADAALGLPAYQGFDQATFKHIADHYQGDNAWFADRVWGRDWAEIFAADSVTAAAANAIDLDADDVPDEGLRAARRIVREVRPVLLAGATPAFARRAMSVTDRASLGEHFDRIVRARRSGA